jgi:Tol biopolymer transport system component
MSESPPPREKGDQPPFWPPAQGRQLGDPTPERPWSSRRWVLIGAIALLALVVGLQVQHSLSSGCPLGVDVGGAGWSPDGKHIALVGHGSSGFHIYSLNLATLQATQLTESQCGNEVWPSWSPSGHWIAYERSNGGSGIYLMRADGSGQRKIIPGASEPEWAPDGKRLAYVADGKLYVAAVAAPQRALLLRTGRYEVGHLAWSPDGKWIAFDGDTPKDYFGDNAGVGVVSARGGRLRIINGGSSATWSPDSKWIAYEVYSNFEQSEIRIASRTGTSDRLLRKVPSGNAVPAWSPRGDRIAIYWYPAGSQGRHARLYLVGRDGGGLRQIYSAEIANTH